MELHRRKAGWCGQGGHVSVRGEERRREAREKERHVCDGVPQGRALGPLLLLRCCVRDVNYVFLEARVFSGLSSELFYTYTSFIPVNYCVRIIV